MPIAGRHALQVLLSASTCDNNAHTVGRVVVATGRIGWCVPGVAEWRDTTTWSGRAWKGLKVAPEDNSGERPLDAIAFALTWMRCGGGAAVDIQALFGCSALQFFRALDKQLMDPPAPLHPDVVVALRAVARRRLWLAA